MTLKFSHILVRRSFITALFLLLVFFSFRTFYTFFSTPTDENWFRNAPSNLMVVKNFYAELISKQPSAGSHPLTTRVFTDSVLMGDLIISVNNGSVKTMKDAYEALDGGPQNEIRIEVLRPEVNLIYTVKAQRNHIPEDFIVLLSNYVLVTDVISGGASERAGMKVGDLILRINEQGFTNATEADRILRLGQIGKTLKYEILRNNHFLELNVLLAKFGIPISVLFLSLSGFFWMCVGVFIVYSRPNIVAARLLGFSFMLIGFSISTLLVRRDFDASLFILVRNILLSGGILLGSAMLLHSFHYFPLERTDLKDKKWIIPNYYISLIGGAVLSTLIDSPIPFILSVIINFIIFLFHKRSAAVEYQRINNIIRWTVTVSGVSILITGLFFIDNPQAIGFGIIGLFLALIPLSYLYTIGRYRLLDMNFRIRRNTQYSVVTAVWGILVIYFLIWAFFQLPLIELPKTNIVFTGASIEISDAPELASQRISSERIFLMVLAIGLTFALLRVRKYGQQFIDKKYFRQQYDYRRASRELGEILSSTLSMEILARDLVKKLSELMKLKMAGVLFFREEECCSCLSVHGFDGTEWGQFCISHEKELINSVKQFNNEFRIDYLPQELKIEFQRQGFHYGIPIRSKEKLIGILLVGEKQSETTFQQEDLSFLSATANQASVAIENAFLYEQLAEKERMKHELQIARRIQLESLPQKTPKITGLDIAGTSIPAMEVGGDFFDYLSNGNGKFTVVIGDVSGKGTSAALYMSKVQGILRSLHGFDLSPKDLFKRANTLLCQDLEKRSFVTVLGAEFHTKKQSVVVARAGHLPLWHYDFGKQEIKKILPRGLGLGLNDASIFASEMEEKTVQYKTGDIFLFATDGVTEAHNSLSDFGEERLQNILSTHREESSEKIQTALLEELAIFVGTNSQHDDQTVVVVKVI